MKVLKYLVPVWFGVMVYTILSFAFGAKGISAYNQLDAERGREQANIEDLRLLNTDFAFTRDSFLTDKESYYVYARELGFGSTGEQFIRMAGLGNPTQPLRFPGEAIYALPPDYISGRTIQFLSFFVAVSLLVCMGVYDFLKFIRD